MKRIELGFTAVLLPLDFICVAAAVFIANSLRANLDILPVDPGRVSYPGYAFLLWYFPLLVYVFAQQRLYILRETRKWVQQLFRVTVGTAYAGMIQFLVILSGRTPFVGAHFPVWSEWSNRVSILTIVYFWILTVILVTLGRWLYRAVVNQLLRQGVGRRRVLLIGTTEVARDLYWTIRRSPALGYEVVGVVKTDPNERNLPVIGNLADLDRLFASSRIDEVMQADPNLPSERVLSIIDQANDHHADFSFAPNLFEVLAANVRVSTLGKIPLLELRRTPLDGWGKILKRLLDFIGALILLILSLPIIAVVAVLIKLQDGGPVFYGHHRVSQGKLFKMYKLRSMIRDADRLWERLRAEHNERGDGPLFKMKNDPRVTPLGRFLRKSRIDEIPQFYNVLRGDMSLVGPRPHLPQEVEKYEKHHRKVLAVKPGVTGVAQISGSSDLAFEQEVRLDTYYLENWSLWKDLEILIRTPFVILFKDRSGS